MAHPTLEDLRTVDLFDDVPDEDLQAWCDAAELRTYAPGERLAEQDEPAPALLLMLEGSARSIRLDGGRPQVVGRQLAPTWSGAIAVLTRGTIGVRMEADAPCRVAVIDSDAARALMAAQPVVQDKVMRQVVPVVGKLSRAQVERERLASLGTMAAGLAHELNNPASAAQRAAADLGEALEVLSTTLGSFVAAGIPLEDARALVTLHHDAVAGARGRTALDALDAADAEDALLDALEARGVAEAWKLVEPLASAGLDEGWVDEVARHAGGALDAALGWVASSLTATTLAAELQAATGQLTRLVGAVKQYTYMDRGGDSVDVDVHEGLETTLTVLGHKLKHTTIRVQRAYDRSLPKVHVHGAELNQVWTNLLDNAIDALDGDGTITLATKDCDGGVLVTVEDDGPGMAPEVRERIFDEFFTTKGVGAGTGLGLPTARRIVTDRHEGTIGVHSEAGRTAFEVWLPYATDPPTRGAA